MHASTSRGSGVLLHITSLPSHHGIGDLGGGAYHFANLLAESRQRYWQVLPLTPTDLGCGNSPYSSPSAFAGNPLLVTLEPLVHDGLIESQEFEGAEQFPQDHVNFEALIPWKTRLLQRAFSRVQSDSEHDRLFRAFCRKHADWLDDYALFKSIKEVYFEGTWLDWPPRLRDRDRSSLDLWTHKHNDAIQLEKFCQYLFFRQWGYLKQHCNKQGIQLIGDIPIYVSFDSADTWAHPHLFKLDAQKHPTHVAGAPPDYFSETGQRWGNPVYNWEANQQEEYAWWSRRIAQNLRLFDLVRLDHFRGFAAYWEIPAEEETALHGQWVPGPGFSLFQALQRKHSPLPLIAEDLGSITEDVHQLLEKTGFPGMKVLQFAFSSDLPTNFYAPHNITPNSVIYTGTHDNNTTRGWYCQDADDGVRYRLSTYFGQDIHEHNVTWTLIGAAHRSVATTSIIPLQDLLNLGVEARLNKPATAKGNWAWRTNYDQLNHVPWQRLRELTELSNRCPDESNRFTKA